MYHRKTRPKPGKQCEFEKNATRKTWTEKIVEYSTVSLLWNQESVGCKSKHLNLLQNLVSNIQREIGEFDTQF